MSLFDGLLEPCTAPQPAVIEKQLPPCTITLKRASNGAEIMLCSVAPPPEHIKADAKKRNLPLFTLDEIPAMRQSAGDSKAIDLIISARLAFGWGGTITTEAA